VPEEAKRREEIQHRVESPAPARWQAPHVPASVTKVLTGPAFLGDAQQLLRVVEPVDIVTGFSQQMRVPPLSARYVQKARANRETEQIDKACYFLSIPLGREEKAVLTEIVGVERGLPPLTRLCQKKTGSRYAPNTDSIAS
jgi:hypothetical protein